MRATLEETAKALGVSVQSVRRQLRVNLGMMRQDLLAFDAPAYKGGKLRGYTREEVVRNIEAIEDLLR